LFLILFLPLLFKNSSAQIVSGENSSFSGGITLGIPSNINLTLSKNINDFNITVSGGYWFKGKGVRADISYPVYRATDFLHSVSFTYGLISMEENRTGSFWG